MSVELEIEDGTPWYLSPDIWVLPGTDPSGPPGTPTAGAASYIWARVHNRGTTAVSNATVRFYWANPATLVGSASATLVGTSYVTLGAGESREVLCVTPWVPSWVNDGHECLVVEAFAAADPLPVRSPTDPFDVPYDRHVAQLNLNLILASMRMAMLLVPFGAAPSTAARAAISVLRVRRVPLADVPVAAAAVRGRAEHEMEEFRSVGIRRFRCGEVVEGPVHPEVALSPKTPRFESYALAATLPTKRRPGGAACFLVEQFEGERVRGGIAVVVCDAAEREQPHGKGD